MVLETFSKRDGPGAKHHQDAPGSIAEKNRPLTIEDASGEIELLMNNINGLEDKLNALLEQEAIQDGDVHLVEQRQQRQKIEKVLREAVDVKIMETLRARHDCRTPDEHTSEEERLDAYSPRNQVMTVEVARGDDTKPLPAIFKPRKGEAVWVEKDGITGINETRPQTGYLREWLAGMIAKSFDSEVVPPTVIGQIDGIIGSIQLKVEAKPACLAVGESWLAVAKVKDLRDVAVLDILVHNTDRHDANFLVGDDGTVWAIDHGLTFPESRFDRGIKSFPLRHFSAGDRVLPEPLLGRLANMIEDQRRYQIIKEAFNLVFGLARGNVFFGEFEKRIRELVKTGEFPDYRMYPNDEKYFWGHAATVIKRKHAP